MGAVRPAIKAATGFFTLAFGVTHARFMSQLPTTPAGAFHATSSDERHCPETTLLYRTIQRIG